jgi:RNA polymerase sigma-70 factor (ECF subfamily)
LFAILRNVCKTSYAQRVFADQSTAEDAVPLWSEAPETPEAQILRHRDEETMRKMVSELPDQFREAIVLREINDLSYREIADIIGAPVGTVMSRLARARAMLRAAWLSAEERG